jgi:diphthine-ammonia ligase
MKKTKVFCSWSGGKECAMALYETQKSGKTVTHLLNMASVGGLHSRTHGIASSWLDLQSEAMGVPIIRRTTSWDGYEETFKAALNEIGNKGIKTGIFGDIDLMHHRQWVERVCSECGITPTLPLWQREREELLCQFINLGFRAIVVATDARYLGKEWLGRQIDKAFMEEAKSLGTIDLCGEKGEYHTFVYDGPIFQKPLEYNIGQITLHDNNWLLKLDKPIHH